MVVLDLALYDCFLSDFLEDDAKSCWGFLFNSFTCQIKTLSTHWNLLPEIKPAFICQKYVWLIWQDIQSHRAVTAQKQQAALKRYDSCIFYMTNKYIRDRHFLSFSKQSLSGCTVKLWKTHFYVGVHNESKFTCTVIMMQHVCP